MAICLGSRCVILIVLANSSYGLIVYLQSVTKHDIISTKSIASSDSSWGRGHHFHLHAPLLLSCKFWTIEEWWGWMSVEQQIDEEMETIMIFGRNLVSPASRSQALALVYGSQATSSANSTKLTNFRAGHVETEILYSRHFHLHAPWLLSYKFFSWPLRKCKSRLDELWFWNLSLSKVEQIDEEMEAIMICGAKFCVSCKSLAGCVWLTGYIFCQFNRAYKFSSSTCENREAI